LRTNKQSFPSIIVPEETTSEDDILNAFKAFAQELSETLLFLRNISEITLWDGEQMVASATARRFAHNGKSHHLSALQDRVGSPSMIDIQCIIEGEVSIHKYILIKSSTTNMIGASTNLSKWALTEKLHPSVTLAVPHQVSDIKATASKALTNELSRTKILRYLS